MGTDPRPTWGNCGRQATRDAVLGNITSVLPVTKSLERGVLRHLGLLPLLIPLLSFHAKLPQDRLSMYPSCDRMTTGPESSTYVGRMLADGLMRSPGSWCTHLVWVGRGKAAA